jgi:hypothetical protein
VSLPNWVWWIPFGFFLVFEGIALFNDKRGDTLSENVWRVFKVRERKGWHWLRWVLAIFMVWLTVHMVAGF